MSDKLIRQLKSNAAFAVCVSRVKSGQEKLIALKLVCLDFSNNIWGKMEETPKTSTTIATELKSPVALMSPDIVFLKALLFARNRGKLHEYGLNCEIIVQKGIHNQFNSSGGFFQFTNN